ncbi:uncharacterized protein EAE97_001063 [Botrytis byssoidea]|uniref:Uncharacterized protein n=1 Tax=Botrytis byssoidea TaxID=139641 RepID=A0A9P5M9G6_9HELO|nr:uncharacterized protein EAE97_001063 [Botrytis byssoidea]KAF7953664.1 hypothetical protein EAE97_001063 [Botrytis byssoidea]
MASSSNNFMERRPRSSSKQTRSKDLILTSPFDAIPNRITPSALLAMPFISILIGVPSRHPTKPIYAIYSSNIASLQYVHGDGTLVEPLYICPLLSFNDGDKLCSRQRLNIIECMNRSARYYQMIHSPSWNKDGPDEKTFRGPFTHEKTVKEALTYISDLRFGPDNIAALRTLPLDRHLVSNLPDPSSPCVSLTAPPTWDFSIHHTDFADPYLDAIHETKLLDYFQTFIQRFRNHVSYPMFKKAAYVLAGMEQVGAIYWQSGREALKTQGGWTVDDFLARFAKYEQFTEEWKFLYAPNPVTWLEAEMVDEARRERMGGRRRKAPWMGLVEGVEVGEVVSWQALGEFYWDDGEEGTGYPRVFPRGDDQFEDGGDHEIVIKNEGSGETEARSGTSYEQKCFGELTKKGHGKNGKRSREVYDDSPAMKRAKSAVLNMISGS